MTIEEFRKLKERQKEIIQYAEEHQDEFKEKEEQYLNEFYSIIRKLLDSDLSSIPFEEWEGLYIALEEGEGELDFSKTHANIDFTIVAMEGNSYNFKGCNLRNTEYFDDIEDATFDESYIENNPKLFTYPETDENTLRALKNHRVTFNIINEHPEIRDYLLPVSFGSYNIDSYVVATLGLDNALRFFDENKELVSNIASYGYRSDGWQEFLEQAEDLSDLSYEDAMDKFYEAIYEYISKVGYISCIDDEHMPKSFIDKHPDIFIEHDGYSSEANNYYEGGLKLSDLRYNRDKFTGKNMFRGTSKYSIIPLFKDLDAYFNEFSPIVDSLLDNSRYTLKQNHVVFNSNEDIIKIIPKLCEDLNGFEVHNIRDFLVLKKYAPDANIGLARNYSGDPTILDLKIDISIIESFEHDYPFLFDSYVSYSNNFITELTNYLLKEGITSIKTYEEFIDIVKEFLRKELKKGSSFIFNLAKKEADHLHKLLPDNFFTQEEVNALKELMSNDSSNYFSDINFDRCIKALSGDFESLVLVTGKYPEVYDKLLSKITSFKFSDTYSRLSYIYDAVGFDKFKEILNIYGVNVLSNINNYSNNIYGYKEKVTPENAIEYIDYIIYTDLSMNHSIDLNSLPDSFKNKYKDVYLPEDAPDDLKEAYYKVGIYDRFDACKYFNFKMFHEHPDWKAYLLQTNFLHHNTYNMQQFFDRMLRIFSDEELYDLLFDYGHVIYDRFESFYLTGINDKDAYKKAFLTKLGEHVITSTYSSYDLPDEFKVLYPNYFLPDNAPDELKDKFYNKSLSIYDFVNHPDYISYFDNTILGLGFSPRFSWVVVNFQNDNSKQFKLLSALEQIGDISLESFLKDYIIKNIDTFDVDKIDMFVKILSRLSYSNSTEIYNFRANLASQLLNTENPLESLDKIEGLFIRNNIPVVGKIYETFKILHPNLQGFNFNEGSKISPELLKRGNERRKVIIFTDLIKCAAGSNNRSLKEYIVSLREGNRLYEGIANGLYTYETLSDSDKQVLDLFYNHLRILFLSTKIGMNSNVKLEGDIIQNINRLKLLLSPDKGMNYNLADRCIDMFCHFAGFETVDDLENYMTKKIKTTSLRNKSKERLEEPITFHAGDYVKGIGDVKYLGRILQNGSVAVEFLGPSAGSDSTPLDTDLSRIPNDTSIESGINSSISSSYGPIWFVLRNDDRFTISRRFDEEIDFTYDKNKYECFSTLAINHYGIRTGFASSEIDYIVVDKILDERIPLEIVMNGFYIPVINKQGRVIFTPEDYDNLRNKMQGLSYYDMAGYDFSNNLVTPEIEDIAKEVEDNNKKTKYKRLRIEKTISDVLKDFGLTLKTKIDGDLSENFAELIDTGSTSRGTNKIGEGDFDFMLRLDRSLISDRLKLDKLKNALIERFESYGDISEKEFTSSGDFRFKGVTIEDVNVDIDISFTVKTDKITYSTDRCLQDRMESLEREDPEKYKYVCANIIYAKKILKEAGCYKSSHSLPPQGGLGGVGIENWILQNGGSFEDAARSFLTAAENTSFSSFVEKYKIYDFGENHYSAKNGLYPHDNFVRNNMDERGYALMVQTLKNYFNRTKFSEEEITYDEETGRKM